MTHISFDALCHAAHPPGGGAGPREAMDALWRAAFALDRWVFAVHQDRPTTPVLHQMDGKTWAFAFTDSARAARFCAENAASVGGAHGLSLAMPLDGARAWIRQMGELGLFGVHFNFGQPGWFAPVGNVDAIHAHLANQGVTAAATSAAAPPPTAASTPAITGERVRAGVTVEFRLASPSGLSPGTQSKTWYFELPSLRVVGEQLDELVHRIFYDANVAMQRRQPGDAAWLKLERATASLVDEARVFAWDGSTGPATAGASLPWYFTRIVWEPAACFVVDDAGRYDGLDANDYSELVAYRALEAGRRSEAEVRAFVAKLYPGKPGFADECIATRGARLANIVVVRPALAGVFRRTPGAQPAVSGPPSRSDLGR